MTLWLCSLVTLWGAAALAQVPSTPDTEQIEAWTGYAVVGTSSLQRQAFGPDLYAFQKPAACPTEGADAALPASVTQGLEAARAAPGDEGSLAVRGGDTATFRLQPTGATTHLWLLVTLLDPHGRPQPSIYAEGLARRCGAHEGLDLRFEHMGLHWQIQGDCDAISTRGAAALAKRLEAQLQPTWLVASPCGSRGLLDDAFMQRAGIEAEQVVEALAPARQGDD
jgi:hypothetical protein